MRYLLGWWFTRELREFCRGISTIFTRFDCGDFYLFIYFLCLCGFGDRRVVLFICCGIEIVALKNCFFGWHSELVERWHRQ